MYNLDSHPSTLFNSKVARLFSAKRAAVIDAAMYVDRVRIERKLRASSRIEKNTQKTILKWEKLS